MANEFQKMQKLAGLITEAQLNENISDEAIERMEGLSNMKSLANLKSSLLKLVPEWRKEGFEEDNVVDYLIHLVENSF